MPKKKDVEYGTGDEASQQPLLNKTVGGDNRVRPPRPQNLQIKNGPQASPVYKPSPDTAPSSVSSTMNNTPMLDPVTNLWCRGDRRLQRLNTELLEAIDDKDIEEIERLLNAGANPNATCRLNMVSACHIAAITGGDALSLLMKFGAEKLRIDTLGRTPLHLAAWAGNSRQVAVLLDFPEDMQDRVCTGSLSSDTEEDLRKFCSVIKELTNIRCDIGEVNITLPKTWKDNIDHNCREIKGTVSLILV